MSNNCDVGKLIVTSFVVALCFPGRDLGSATFYLGKENPNRHTRYGINLLTSSWILQRPSGRILGISSCKEDTIQPVLDEIVIRIKTQEDDRTI